MAAEAAVPRTFDQPSTGAAFRRLVDEAVACFPDAPVVIRCRSGLAARLESSRQSLGAARVTVDDAVPDGVIVEAADGSARVDNTLIARLRRLRPGLSIALVDAVADPP
jgi:vacuolar-type H+-ATPase subunit E/Vma4